MRNWTLAGSIRVDLLSYACALALLLSTCNVLSFAQDNVDWRYHGNTLSNERYQDVDQINPSNVHKLKPAWVFHTGVSDPNMSMEMTPLVVNGVMYVPTGDDDVFALDAATGHQIWAYHPTDLPALSTLPICCNHDSRGVAMGHGLIFVARLDATLVALNAATGKVVWKTAVDFSKNGASMTIAPQFADHKVIVGVSGGEYAVRGHVDAYDPETGKLIWRFWTTEPTTWEGNSYLTGGAAVWGNPSYDPELHTLYFATGNAYPLLSGGGRAGKDFYSSSIVAIDSRNGEYKWHFQFAHHDMWDFDGPQPTVLFDLNGTPALYHTSKTGYTHILDRRTGKSLYPYFETPVSLTPSWQNPWPTQPESSIESLTEHTVEAGSLPAGFTAAPQWTPPSPALTMLQPFFDGGMEWPPAAYSPRTHFIYSHSRYLPQGVGLNEAADFLGSAANQGHGVYGAIDTRTGKIAWKIPVTLAPDSGVGVAGDLVFFGESTGLFHAVDARTGEMLWTFNSSTVPKAGGATASPAFYVVNGREYVAYGFGGNPFESPLLGDAIIAFALPDHDE